MSPMTPDRADERSSSARFWSKLARKYSASPIKDQTAYETTLARTSAYLRPDHSVLELGCGTGSTAMILAGNTRSYLATDFAAGMIDIAEEKLAQWPIPVHMR